MEIEDSSAENIELQALTETSITTGWLQKLLIGFHFYFNLKQGQEGQCINKCMLRMQQY